jgi:O-antigen/teichoic acid export membrane protein
MKSKLTELMMKSTILKSSVNLMISSGLIAGFGFFFWIVVANKYTPTTVGIATTLLSASGFISLLGLAGVDTVFIRFLKKSPEKDSLINSGLMITAIFSTVLSIMFCVLTPLLAPKLKFIDHNSFYIIIFVTVTILTNWNVLTNAALIALQRTSLVLIINIIFSAFKLSLPFLLPGKSPIILFSIVGLAQLLNVVLSILIMIKVIGYRPSLSIKVDLIRKHIKYGTGVYFANVFNLLPDSALPLIVVNELGATSAAYFYVAFTIANLLYTIAFSTSQVTTAEASADEENLMVHLRKGLAITIALMTPAIIVTVAVCPFILEAFGNNYKAGASGVLRIMALSGIPVAAYIVLGTFFKLTNNLKGIIAASATNAVVILCLSFVLIHRYGLLGIGWAWFIGSFASVIVGFLFLIYSSWDRGTGINKFKGAS